jgi:hypothetical protein
VLFLFLWNGDRVVCGPNPKSGGTRRDRYSGCGHNSECRIFSRIPGSASSQ